MKDSNG